MWKPSTDILLYYQQEGNKEIAKGNTDASLGTRAEAAKDAVSDKLDESKHDSKAELHKQKAQN